MITQTFKPKISPIFRALKCPVKLRRTPQAYPKEKPLLGIIQDRVRSQRPGRRVLRTDVRTSISMRRPALEEAKPSEGGKEQGSTHASKAANTKCPQGSFRTSPARVVGRALSKRTSPAAPKPGSYWGSQGTQGQGGEADEGEWCTTKAPAATLLIAAHSRPSPGAELLCSRKKSVPTAHVAPSATGTNPWVTAMPAQSALTYAPWDSSKGRGRRHTR